MTTGRETDLQVSSDERLGSVEVDQNAFELIGGLKAALIKSEYFRYRLSHTYFGEDSP